ncbi:MAG: UMP kinase [Puniceicoccales bacterium]|nr:UMP kinase [Puniceicoccales bacterium]
MSIAYRRIVLKIGGEFLCEGTSGATIVPERLQSLCQQIVTIRNLGVELAIVVGGGNIFRGHTYNDRDSGFRRNDADKMGMLATAINALALRSYLEDIAIPCVVQSALALEGITPHFSVQDSLRALQSGRIVLLCCGTGNPFFSTDSAAALRACELEADILLKATKVDGVYDCDPFKNPDAKKFPKLSFREVLEKNLQIMDRTALVLCMENNIPIRIFSSQRSGGIAEAVENISLGTLIGNENDIYGNG